MKHVSTDVEETKKKEKERKTQKYIHAYATGARETRGILPKVNGEN